MRDIHTRLKSFAIEIIKLTQSFPKIAGVDRIISQLIGSGTSPAANAREADSARSRPEFISTMGIALKELREVAFWLEIIHELGWGDKNKSAALLQESQELGRIIATIILNTKRAADKKSC